MVPDKNGNADDGRDNAERREAQRANKLQCVFFVGVHQLNVAAKLKSSSICVGVMPSAAAIKLRVASSRLTSVA